MGILVADRQFLGEIGVLDEGMTIYGGENVELAIRVSYYCTLWHQKMHIKKLSVKKSLLSKKKVLEYNLYLIFN